MEKMSHFYARIKGNRGKKTCQGTKDSGIQCHVNGWNSGIEIEVIHFNEGVDRYMIYSTGGSNNSNGVLIAQIDFDSETGKKIRMESDFNWN
jgi:hypothetical protein